MSVTRKGSEAIDIAQRISADYIKPMDPDGTSSLSTQMLKAACSQRLRESSAIQAGISRNQPIRLLGYFKISDAEIFRPADIDQDIPKSGFLKDIAGSKVTLRKARVKKYSDFEASMDPYLVCNVPVLSKMPISIDESEFNGQMKKYRKRNTDISMTSPNQLCTWGAYMTSFHRDTMFSKKVHTLSPCSMKLWCFEKRVGQLNIIKLGDAYMQMRHVIKDPTEFDFYIQEPGEIVEHQGGYAHFVITFNRSDSPYGQWSALIGWEINSSQQIDRCMRVETPLLEGRGGILDEVSEALYLQACSRKTTIRCALLKEQGENHNAFLELQREKSQKQVELLHQSKKRKLQRYAGLKYQARPKVEPNPSSSDDFTTVLL